MGLALPRLFGPRLCSLLVLGSRFPPFDGRGVLSLDWSLRIRLSLLRLWLVRNPSPSDCFARAFRALSGVVFGGGFMCLWGMLVV